MTGLDQDPELIKQYLLGGLDEKRREQIDKRVFTTPEFKESVLVIEDQLFEAYVDGTLTAAERESFIERFLQTPQQRRRVRIAQALKERAAAREGGSPAAALPEEERRPKSWLGRVIPAVWLYKPATAVGLIAAILAVTYGGWLGWKSWQRTDNERELARLNSTEAALTADGGRLPSSVVQQPLLPERYLRGPSGVPVAPPMMTIEAGTDRIQYQLKLLDSDYDSFQAMFERKAGGELFAVKELKSRQLGRERVVVIAASAALFDKGDYLIRLTGRDETGQTSEVDVYPFVVARP
jgi:hypothetical protein